MSRDFHYRWEWDCASSPEALWPLVSDTNRFDRDAALPALERLGVNAGQPRVRFKTFGMTVEWEEAPYEWTRPCRFGVERRYLSGPVLLLRVLVDLEPRPGGGTHLVFQVWVTPRHLLGRLAVPWEVGVSMRRRFDRVIRRYDALAGHNVPEAVALADNVMLAPGGAQRLGVARGELIGGGADAGLVDRLAGLIQHADDLTVSRLRPYGLADAWNLPRRALLELMLKATRAGVLEFRWDVLCPLCRGVKQSTPRLAGLSSHVHCDACLIDFQSNFDRLVEISFRPNPAIRAADAREYCVGSPQRTPHIVVQQRLGPRESRLVAPALEQGHYRARVGGVDGGRLISVTAVGATDASLRVDGAGWPAGEQEITTTPRLTLDNQTDREQVLLIERTEWTDQAVTAAEITTLQAFRDLFSSEALRPGEQISVGSLAVLFTDLRDSTKLYRTIGDAPAFGRVMSHFDLVRQQIAAHDGAIVKLMGDAVMAVFRNPASALRATLAAQKAVADTPDPLTLRAGLHYGPCIAINQNDRLDYFGSTVNMAARLENLSTGRDVIISGALHNDPEVAPLLADGTCNITSFETTLKGFDDDRFELYRVTATAAV